MAWATERNIQLTGSTTEERALQALIILKETLVSAGWSLIGNGDGVDDVNVNLAGGATDYFPAFPSVTGMAAGAWFAVESASGAQLVFQAPTGSDVFMYASPGGNYTDDSPTHSVRLGATTPPADEIDFTVSGYGDIGTYANRKFTIAYTDDATSFVLFGAYSGDNDLRGFWLELDGAKTGDATPYVGSWYLRVGYDCWGNLYNPEANSIKGWHPDGAVQEYCFGKPMFDSVDIINVLPPDPVSGDEQIIDCLVGCQVAASYHIRGVAPGIKWCSGLRSTGDMFDSDRYVCIGDNVIDGWNSTDSFES